MELRRLRSFVDVAEEENVSRATAKLHVSPPGVSRQIRDLEDELGFPLLARTGKSVRLTAAGTVFSGEARDLLSRARSPAKNSPATRRASPSARRTRWRGPSPAARTGRV